MLCVMSRRLVPAAVALVAACALALVAAAPSQAIIVGLADQQPASFSDPKFRALPIQPRPPQRPVGRA